MSKSQLDCIVDAIESDGWIRDVHARTGRYWVYRRPGSPVRVFLGAMGSMRHSAKGTISTAVPVKSSLREAYVERGRQCKAEASLALFMAS